MHIDVAITYLFFFSERLTIDLSFLCLLRLKTAKNIYQVSELHYCGRSCLLSFSFNHMFDQSVRVFVCVFCVFPLNMYPLVFDDILIIVFIACTLVLLVFFKCYVLDCQ